MKYRQSSTIGRKRLHEQLEEERDAGRLRERRDEAGDRQRRALVGVRRVHVERHGRHLEAEPADDQRQAEEHRRLDVVDVAGEPSPISA